MGQAVGMHPVMGYLEEHGSLECPENGSIQAWSKRRRGRMVNRAKAEALGCVRRILVGLRRYQAT